MPNRSSLHWPLRCLPVCVEGGTYPMQVPGCNRTYRHPTLALHLHDYSGIIWIDRHRFQLVPGDITITPGGRATSRYELAGSGSHLCLHLERATDLPVSASLRMPLHLRLGPAVSEARERFWRVIDFWRQAGSRRNSAAACAASAAAQELFLWLHLQTARTVAPRRAPSRQPDRHGSSPPRTGRRDLTDQAFIARRTHRRRRPQH